MEENYNDYSLATELFMELASETRFSILASLSKKPSKLSSLSRELGVTVQDVHRNLNRLMQEGLVKRLDGTFYATEYARIVMKQIPDLMVMKKNRRYFEEHGISAVIPDKFLQRIGVLEDCKPITSVTAVFQGLKKLQSSSNNSLRIIVSQTWPEEGEILIDRASHGVKVYALVGQNTIFPRNVVENILPKMNELMGKGILERRMVERVDVALFIADDKAAAIAFANQKGEVDMNTMFIGESPAFCEWCLDYFEYVWKDSRPFNINKVKIVEY